MIVFTFALLGSTTWFCCCAPLELDDPPCAPTCCAPAPPGVTSTVLLGGGGTLPLPPPELEPVLAPPCWQACTATASVSEFLGITTSFEPGGALVVPDCTVCASEHGGTMTVRSSFCLGISTTRTPGDESAAPTGSLDALEPPPPLLPQAVRPMASAVMLPATTVARRTPLLVRVICCLPPPGTWPAGLSAKLLPPSRSGKRCGPAP